MNKKLIGEKFEIECIPILESLFNNVEYCAGSNCNSNYDFICTRNGKKYNVDAKYISSKNGKPRVSYSQFNVDLIICKKAGELFIYDSSALLGNVNFTVKPKKANETKFNHATINYNESKMKTQIKSIGTSKGIILSKEFLKFHDLELGDWIDISDIIKVRKQK